MKAMILAAGLGTRLRPFTLKMPKIMVPINGKPLLDYHLRMLKKQGIKEIGINLHHFPEKINGFLKNGKQFGIKVLYSYEKKLLGTAGGIKKLENFFKETFLVLYGDNLIATNLEPLIQFHKKKRTLVTIALYQCSEPWTQGVVQLDKKARIVAFIEKPPKELCSSNELSNAGIYVLEPEIFSHIPSNSFFDFGKDLFPALISKNIPMYGFQLDGYVRDIGNPKRLSNVIKDMRQGNIKQ
ncbi:MAG: nucleotidyltransferase family protein [Elusimicrobia bacterium]|nr:nucleotidyltransferase family protein [Elusimicrobiota bacterium]